jgi:hypothetical protein
VAPGFSRAAACAAQVRPAALGAVGFRLHCTTKQGPNCFSAESLMYQSFMHRAFPLLVAGLLVLFGAAPAQTFVCSDRVGDKDGFGLGVNVDEAFDLMRVRLRQSNEITDVRPFRRDLPISWTHQCDPGALDSLAGITVHLELFTGGQGVYGPSRVLVNGQEIGMLSDGYTDRGSVARRDVFDLTPLKELLRQANGRIVVTILTQYSDGTYVESYQPDQYADIWVLDYSELTVRGPGDAAPQ